MNKPLKKITNSLLLFITLSFSSGLYAELPENETLPKVIIETELGNITIEIDQQKNTNFCNKFPPLC